MGLFGDAFETGEFFAEEKFERGAATGGNEGVVEVGVGFHEGFDKAGGVAATDDGGGCVWFFTNHFGSDSRGGGVGGVFGLAEQAVPDDSIGIGDEIGELNGGERADV